MLAGLIVGGAIWALFCSLFFIFPEGTSFAAAVFIGPLAAGYYGALWGGNRIAWTVTSVGTIMALILGLLYLPNTSWNYPHDVLAGVALFTTLLVLGNFIFLSLGSCLGIRDRGPGQRVEEPMPRGTMKSASAQIPPDKAADISDALVTKLSALAVKEGTLMGDLTILKEGKGLELISPELLGERKVALEKQLLDIVLEKERLMRNAATMTTETAQVSQTQAK